MNEEENETKETKKDKFVYYLILIVAVIIGLYLIIGFLFIENESWEYLQQTAGHARGGASFSQGTLLIIFVIPIIFLAIHCIKKIREK